MKIISSSKVTIKLLFPPKQRLLPNIKVDVLIFGEIHQLIWGLVFLSQRISESVMADTEAVLFSGISDAVPIQTLF